MVRYKQTLLGVAWVIIQPLATMLIFTLLFGRLAGLDQTHGGSSLSDLRLRGAASLDFFLLRGRASSNSLVNNSHLISKVYFPRMIIPAATIGAGMVDFGLSFRSVRRDDGLLQSGRQRENSAATPTGHARGCIGSRCGLFLSALNVRYRDIRHALPFTLQLWMFASPVNLSAGNVTGEMAFSANPQSHDRYYRGLSRSVAWQRRRPVELAVHLDSHYDGLADYLRVRVPASRTRLRRHHLKTMKPMIKAEGIAKEYRIGTPEASYRTLRDALSEAFMNPMARLRRAVSSSNETIWALKDINFEVHHGRSSGLSDETAPANLRC